MQFVTHNTHRIDSTGTCKQGDVTATHAELVSLFGPPAKGDGNKTDAEWTVRFEDGVIATIYNWKNGANYCGNGGTPVEQIKDWTVGGQVKQAADRISIALDLLREKQSSTDRVTDAIAVGADMLRSIEKRHGKNFATAVYVACLSIKANELLRLALSARDKRVLNDMVAEGMQEAMACLIAQSLSVTVRSAGLNDLDSGMPQQVMDWATRITEAEAQAAGSVFANGDGSA
jgi:hypothetical protein